MKKDWKLKIEKQDKEYKEEIIKIMEKVEQRPYLFEIKYHKDDQTKKIKSILAFLELMKKNGVKDPKSITLNKATLKKMKRSCLKTTNICKNRDRSKTVLHKNNNFLLSDYHQ